MMCPAVPRWNPSILFVPTSPSAGSQVAGTFVRRSARQQSTTSWHVAGQTWYCTQCRLHPAWPWCLKVARSWSPLDHHRERRMMTRNRWTEAGHRLLPASLLDPLSSELNLCFWIIKIPWESVKLGQKLCHWSQRELYSVRVPSLA